MPTIAQILAAKKSATAKADPEADALDARLAPVKPAVATAARKQAGIILSKELPPAQAIPIVGPQDDRRSLGSSEGETIDLTPMTATQAEATWHAAVNSFETELCLMRDPLDPERAWIAVRMDGQEQWPILLKSLPLYEHPRTARDGGIPF